MKKEQVPVCIYTYREWCGFPGGFIAIVFQKGLVLTDSIVPPEWIIMEANIDEQVVDVIDHKRESKLYSPPIVGRLMHVTWR